jgi:hypothetical protein
MSTAIVFSDEDVGFKLRKIITDNGGQIKKLNDTTIIAIHYKASNRFTDRDGIHYVYRLIDENMIEVIYKDDSCSFAEAIIIV